MIEMTLSEIATVVDGVVHDDAGVTVSGPASLDSRVVETDGLFVAFLGERSDGHDHAADAVAAGAAAVLGSRRLNGLPMILVKDTRDALGKLARHVLRSLPHLTVVALTGSQGKTSTKDLLAGVLADAGRTVATPGSLNNELGLPLTALHADPDTEYLVLEMGARGVGHLRYLCGIAEPDVSLVLNVGKAHLAEFGTQRDIATAKGEIIDALKPAGTAVLNADDPLVAQMASRTNARVVTFGERADADIKVVGLELDELGRPGFDLTTVGAREHVQLRMLGKHQAGNAAAAAAVAVAVGVPLREVTQSLSKLDAASKWRMELHELPSGITVINDAYNANPDSMRAALKTLAAIGRRRGAAGRTIAVLGEMRELGESSQREHDAIGRLAVRLDINQLLVVGEPARPLHLGAYLEGSWGEESVFVADHAAALRWLGENLVAGDVVLFKASRAVELELLAEAVVSAASVVDGHMERHTESRTRDDKESTR